MLWKAFAKHGRISDVYVAKKKSIAGKTFGFARFYNIDNPKLFEGTLKSTFIGTHRLKVHLARYQGKINTSSVIFPTNNNTTNQQHVPNPINKINASHHPSSKPINTHGHSYANILITEHARPKHLPTPLTIHSCPELTNLLHRLIVGELETLDTFPNLKNILADISLPNTRIKYLGGFHVLLELENNTQTELTINNTQLLNCFESLKPWDERFVHNNRLVWLSIEGLPPNAWHEAAFSRIAGVWGDVVFPEKCKRSNNNLVSGKVCVRTRNMDFIQVNMPVLVDGTHVCIRIRELVDKEDVYHKGGGWIREQGAVSRSPEGLNDDNNSNRSEYSKSQMTSVNSNFRNASVTSPNAFVHDSYFEDLSVSPKSRKEHVATTVDLDKASQDLASRENMHPGPTLGKNSSPKLVGHISTPIDSIEPSPFST
ncbi:hypothetical protein CTI12_AA440180 [Artemisia annua]|uniref:Uncharacterized protein n=1 Tax=Artemisia annua TaxID=35608 RepID=A0A2U1LY38_ARTAN|nr:hypothetical protein CTI12_AA440180 [Artemisia annua]